MITLIQDSKLSGELSYKLLLTLFGPNANMKFSMKKNLELIKAITLKFQGEQVTKYFAHLKGMYENPPVEEAFGATNNKEDEAENDESDEEEN